MGVEALSAWSAMVIVRERERKQTESCLVPVGPRAGLLLLLEYNGEVYF